ncbi:MAG: hypothetical protein AUK47_28910 [Deltaproteobacteria bacterium CG2_30_63_29]|nr:MAG: hypothetical protein AUK47_28910 [Deltaproteobacteria bacterium CG2_30_63_29]
MPQAVTTIVDEIACNKVETVTAEPKGPNEERRRYTAEQVFAAADTDLDFSNTNLAGLDLRGVQLAGRDLSGADLSSVKAAPRANGIGDRQTGTNFAHTKLVNANLSSADLQSCLLNGSDMTGAILESANLSKVSMEEGSLSNASLMSTNLEGARLLRTRFDGVSHFETATVKGAQFLHMCLDDLSFGESDLGETHFQFSSLKRVVLSDRNLTGCQFRSSDLSNAVLCRSTIQGTAFDNANLRGADIRGVTFGDKAPTFIGANTTGCIVDRETLDSLPGISGLTIGQRALMDIRDDAATLRSDFTGFWTWVHGIALVSFLAPYLFFVLWKLGESGVLPIIERWNGVGLGVIETQSVLGALADFIWTGGTGAGLHWAFLLFLLSLA